MSGQTPSEDQDLDLQQSHSIESIEEVPRDGNSSRHRGDGPLHVARTPGATVSYRQQQAYAPSALMNTIDNGAISGSDGFGSDHSHHKPPSHPFFSSQPQFYDSDGSDGSIVYAYKPPASGPQEKNRRDKFPSFDSMASSGSLRYVPQNNIITTPQYQISPNQLSKVNPQLLPYDQRRKLMQQRQQQQASGHRPQEPTPPRPDANRHMQFLSFPDSHQYQAGHIPSSISGIPPLNHMQPGYPVQPSLAHPQNLALQQQFRLSPYRSTTPPRYDSRPPTASKQGGRTRAYPQSQQSAPLHTYALPPSGMQRPPAPGNSSAFVRGGGGIDSLHPIDKDLSLSRPNQRYQRQTNPPELNPPPPPPLPQNYHVRTDSTGSVSSLGSQGSLPGLAGEDDHMEQAAGIHRKVRSHRRSGSSGGGGSTGSANSFLQMLNPWSPKQANLTDFHRMNQEFLKRSGKKVGAKATSPQQHRERVGSLDHPPPSRGTHKRLPSIDNDDWGEPDEKKRKSDILSRSSSKEDSSDGELSSSLLSDDEEDSYRSQESYEADERTSLLPPTGISSNEHVDVKASYTNPSRARRSRTNSKSKFLNKDADVRDSNVTVRWNNTTSATNERQKDKKSKKKKKKNSHRSRRSRHVASEDSSFSSEESDLHSSSSSSYDYRQWTRKRAKMLEKERAKLIAQWKEEARAEAEAARQEAEENRWYRRIARSMDVEFGAFFSRAFKVYASVETFICNLPQTVGAIAMAIVTLGVVWFKFAEENLDSCEPVHFHSAQCTFPEFPGCFYCDKNATMYKVAVNFHFACSIIAGILAFSFVMKMMLATKVVLDEMSSPTTSSPAGLLCMTTVCVFAGRGAIGQFLVAAASCIHLCLVIWFIYMALAYHIMPEPSWFPNTVGVGLSAVKTWLYYPMPGHFLMAISLSLNFLFFPISLIRVILNEKISATVGWMQMSAPAIALYSLTIMAQPSFEEEHPDITRFQHVHRMVYLPCMHVLFVFSVIGLVASLQSFWVRWADFKKKEFSPAHAAFCFPTLSHANAIQAYRGAVNSFSNVRPGSPPMLCLYIYWVIVLVGGTIATVWITAKFFYCLPSWTNIDVADEEEPPAPYETTMTLQNVIATGEALVQPFVSPAILQANETGALVMVRRSGEGGQPRYRRTRRLTALGFEPIMQWSEMERERAFLLEWVVKHPPRRRNRTLSVPGIDFSYGANLGTGNSGVFGVGSNPRMSPVSRRGRASTAFVG